MFRNRFYTVNKIVTQEAVFAYLNGMNRATTVHLFLLVLTVVLLSAGCAFTSQRSTVETDSGAAEFGGTAPSVPADASRYEGTAAAPEFPSDLDWVNAVRPLSWNDLRGKIVVLDFWTYGCINCIHMIPVLEQLQEKYADELVVIGVHSAKFENEGSTENIRQIARRYGRDEPIVNDQDFRVWRAWGARAWPTIAVVDPRGNVLALDSGEIPFSALDEFISNVEARFDELGLIDRAPFELLEVRGTEVESLLLFPGKVLADPDGDRLFISDSNHNRIIVTSLDTGDVLDVIGSGGAGLGDGGFETAAFAKPQGLALSGQTLYVADLDNHAIRAADLANRTVRTIAGTGVRGSGRPSYGEVITNPAGYDLRSPWALELVDEDTLFIAMAGTHQIWKYLISAGTLEAAIGNGRESLLNGTLATSELAQPSGLFHTDGKLYFADSESSSIRVADLAEDRLATVAGPLENTLFDFGDRDGEVGDSRLQHPLGVTGSPDGTIYITDTYNSRIKAIDPETAQTQTIFGLGGQGGYRDGGASIAEFDEPGGLDYANGKLYVADTNNHAVRVIDLETGIVDTLVLGQIDSIVGRPGDDGLVTLFADNTPAGLTVTMEEQQANPGSGEISIRLSLPEGYKLNPLIQSTYELSVEGEGVCVDSTVLAGPVNDLSFSLPAEFASGSAAVRIRFTIYYCEADLEQLCILDDSAVVVPVVVQGSGVSGIAIEHRVELPELPTFGGL